MEGSSAQPAAPLEQEQMLLGFEGWIYRAASSALCTSQGLYGHSNVRCSLTRVLPACSCMTCLSGDLYNSVFIVEFSFSLRIVVPVWHEQEQKVSLLSFSFACCCARSLATFQLQTVTCCRVLVWLRLARQGRAGDAVRTSSAVGWCSFFFFFNFGG